jgi:hypothetical protein
MRREPEKKKNANEAISEQVILVSTCDVGHSAEC